MVAIKGRKNTNKNPPIFSHEFVIQNHADIVSCVAMVFVVGLMVQVTSPLAYTFIAVHHNVSASSNPGEMPSPEKYTTGWKDACAVFFYFLITIVMHAVIQEYIFDKITKRLHLSKIKLSQFNESSQLIVFYLSSAIWGTDIIIRENLLLNITSLWDDYPALLSFSLKLFFIGQFAYWLHCYPELYFQRAKKEEIFPRVIQATIGLLFTFGAYFFNFQQVGVILLVLHYVGDALQHSARIIQFVDRSESGTRLAFLIANPVFISVRIISIGVAALVFFYGLPQTETSLDYATGNFNVSIVRYTALVGIVLFQVDRLYRFIKEHLQRSRESNAPIVSKLKTKQKPKKKEGKKSTQSEDDDLPEVDQATNKNLRSRTAGKAK
ncbi:translocating chain-associated membrane protein 1 [Neodiprion pinetum]|uniref:translocating chain-associated membrane protein 1 n=1 Tax=Neodiprion pinetum TaxID=441929 RepID=UPI001EDF1101|nr:translocating chain-associated membrane protein 1 [Neodiprion pinetum]